MKYDFYESPTGEDVVLKITNRNEVHRIAFTHSELHELDWAIRKYLEEQPFRVAKEATGSTKHKKRSMPIPKSELAMIDQTQRLKDKGWSI